MRDRHAAFEAVLTRCGARLLLYARSLGSVDAEEVVQEAFANYWEQIRAGAEIRNPAAYLAASVRHAAARAARHRRRFARLEPEAWFVTEDGESAVSSEEIEHALRGLPDEQREVVMLKVWLGLTFEQIAALVGIPMNTAASRYRYGMEKLRQREQVKQ